MEEFGQAGRGKEAADLANALADEQDADVIFINRQIMQSFAEDLLGLITRRKKRRGTVYVIIVTEGGLGEAAYRACRLLQMNYSRIVCVIPGWCKSAGTLFCAGAHELLFSEHGELGPIDVQLRRADEIGERDSGLAIDAAFDGLSEATFKLFENFMLGIKARSFGSVTFKTAADIAAQVSVGLVAPIFAQLDPVKVGETHRSVRVAEEYAKRLNLIGKNIQMSDGYDAIGTLVRGYPSHDFVIDYIEACMLFNNVALADNIVAELVHSMGDQARVPLSVEIASPGGRGMEYLNDEEAEVKCRPQGGTEGGDNEAPRGGSHAGDGALA